MSIFSWIRGYFCQANNRELKPSVTFNGRIEPLSLTEYQNFAFTVAKYPERGTGSVMAVVYCGLGLGEAGEVQGKIKKILRDSKNQITHEIREALIAEMGDNLWYIAALATELGVTLDEVGKKNLYKLFDRAERGVIGGSGDER